jgi:hypothetical protein
MKAALLAALLLVALAALSQQNSQPYPQQPRQAGDNQNNSNDAAAPVATAAPQPGHPLDPADVDVLTSKNKPQPYHAAPYYSIGGGYGYGMGYGAMNRGLLWNQRGFGAFTPFGPATFGAGSGLVFFGRGFVNPRPFVFRH